MRLTRKQFLQLTPHAIAAPHLGWRCCFFGLLRIADDLFRWPKAR